MSTASRPVFMRHFSGAWRAPQVPDPADLGTAFGLEQSLDALPLAPGESPPTAPPVTPVAPWRLWLGRKLGA